MKLYRILLIGILALNILKLNAQSIRFEKEKLEPNNVSMSLEKLMGRDVVKVTKNPAIKEVDQPTFVKIKGTKFQNGTIEVSVLSRLLHDAPELSRGFIGVAFRINEDNTKFESIYIRPTNARAVDQIRRNHSIQYFSFPDFPTKKQSIDRCSVLNALQDQVAEDGGLSKLSFTSPSGLGEIEAQTVLLATGVRERPRSARLIPGTRPQGIYTTGSLQRFVYQEQLSVGKKAVIVGAELVSLSALMTLQHADVKCLMMITEESKHQIEFPYVVMKWAVADILIRTPILTNTRITNIFGQKRVEGIELTSVNGQINIVECDTLIFTGNWIPENEMARLGGLAIDPITRGPKIDAEFHSSIQGIFAAGNLLRGVETADHCAIEGIKAGRAIAKYLRK